MLKDPSERCINDETPKQKQEHGRKGKTNRPLLFKTPFYTKDKFCIKKGMEKRRNRPFWGLLGLPVLFLSLGLKFADCSLRLFFYHGNKFL